MSYTPPPCYLLGDTPEEVGIVTCAPAPVPCPPSPCPIILSSECVFYSGDNLVNSGILTQDTLTIALQKLDANSGVIPLTTKGDIYTFSDEGDRLPVGTDGQHIVADSTTALGVKWVNTIVPATLYNSNGVIGETREVELTGTNSLEFYGTNYDMFFRMDNNDISAYATRVSVQGINQVTINTEDGNNEIYLRDGVDAMKIYGQNGIELNIGTAPIAGQILSSVDTDGTLGWINTDYVDLTTAQTITGLKNFYNGLSVGTNMGDDGLANVYWGDTGLHIIYVEQEQGDYSFGEWATNEFILKNLSNTTYLQNKDLSASIELTETGIGFKTDGNIKKGSFSFGSMSVDRVFAYPDKSGTVALLDDVTTPNLQAVTDVGNTTTLNIGVASVNDLKLFSQVGVDVDNIGIGANALLNNIGVNSLGIGTSALQDNTGTQSVGVGYFALENNTGFQSNGFGNNVLQNNTGTNANGFGRGALQNNKGVSSNGVGDEVLVNNLGANVNGIGFSSLRNNIGNSSNAVGTNSLRENIGVSSNAFGHAALQQNTGANANGFGESTLLYNQKDNNTAIGDGAYSTFLDDTANDKTFAFGDVNATTDRITVTAHGFGVTNAWINLKYTEGTSTIGGLSNNTIYQAKVIDANTLGFYELISGTTYHGQNITSAGAGTGHTFTPQYTYGNVTVLGANAEPTKSNQVVLGDANVTEVTTDGLYTTTNETTSATKGIYNNILKASNGEIIFKAQMSYWDTDHWTTSNSYAIGEDALQNGNGYHNLAMGYQAMRNFNGYDSISIGYKALDSATAIDVTAIGYQAMSQATGSSSIAIGSWALQLNTQSNCVAVGEGCLNYNTGLDASAFGHEAGTLNEGNYTSCFGNRAGSNNLGDDLVAFGVSTGFKNTGDSNIAIGNAAFSQRTGSGNTIIGHNANNTEKLNVAAKKDVASAVTDINLSTNTITITAHGFGSIGDNTLLEYTTTGSAMGGLTNNAHYGVTIIDANSFEVKGANIWSIGTDTHSFTPHLAYDNVTVLGAFAESTKSNQVVLGDTNVTEVRFGGLGVGTFISDILTAPISSSDTGTLGEIRVVGTTRYECIATDTWISMTVVTSF